MLDSSKARQFNFKKTKFFLWKLNEGEVSKIAKSENHMNKKSIVFFTIMAASLFLGKNVFATLPTPVISQMIGFSTGNLGSVGSVEGWAGSSGNVTVTNGSGSLDGTALGLLTSAGDKAYVSATVAVNTLNQFATNKTYAQTANVNIYHSFLYKFHSADSVGSLVKICEVHVANSGTSVYWDLEARTNNSGQIQLGVNKNSGGAAYASMNINVGDTVFVVVRHQILPGASDDEIDLWIDPPASSFGADEMSLPPPSVSTTTGTEPSSTTGPGRFYVDSGANAEFDELRIATNWATVTPPFGQCVSAGITTSPISQTNVAEISDFFTVVASGTSPTYQWQISGPNSSNWTNITGAIASSYTTPNLVLATDNGNKYRAIVSVPCDATTATSAVATVTLTAPIITHIGLLLHDTFSAGILEPILPITATNAAWYTADSSKLDIYHGGNPGSPMTSTPISGGSSLWLAYFTAITNLPVDLAVGNTIKVTCPLTPNSYSYFTNNASLRIGLFDYADGGNRVIADDSTVGGSAGNGINVMGYMLSLDFGPTFVANSPLSLLARNGLNDNNLMGTTSDYVSLGSGPSGGGYANATAFQAGVQYTLVFSVTRNDVNSVIITNSITGGGTNWTYSVTETNLAYHRFDAFAIRPNSIETSADSFNITDFKVEVLAGPSTPGSISLATISRNGNSVALSWTPTPAGSFSYTIQRKINLTDANWTTLQAGILTTSYTDITANGNTGFYRVTSP